MSVTVRIPPPLRTETAGEAQVEAEGASLREILDDLSDRYPSLGRQLLANGGIAPYVNVYVDGEDVRTRDGMDTAVSDGTTIILLPAVAGGLH